MPKNSLFPFNRNALESNWEQNNYSCKDVHDEKPRRIWIVICKEMCMKKTHSKRIWVVICTEMCMKKTHTQRNG